MNNIGRSDEWKASEVRYVLNKLLEIDPNLYDRTTETIGYAYWHNILCIIAIHRMWGVEDAQNYLRTGSDNPKDWKNNENNIQFRS